MSAGYPQQHVQLLDSVAGGDMIDKPLLLVFNGIEYKKNRTFDETLMSSDEEAMTTNVKK